MAEKPLPSPAQPLVADDAPVPQQEGVTIDKQQQITPVIQEENSNPNSNSNTRDLNAPSSNAPKDMPKDTPKDNKAPLVSVEPNARVVTPLHMLGENPAWINCPFCRHCTKTRVTREGTSTQTLAGAVLCLFCVCLACLPCVGGWCENTNIFCSSCNNRVATIPHDGPIQLAPVAR
ncbi:hypothetical protein F4820DRAFT_450142 [Hypoxylon rubiginosum]|uniref:Uncharacterized protein n=1 Tax=Hypoxylon rubiginosum TaxID=110542 RepID=A0ACB9YW99_9PEZI|nr:hypothetical protein F4820DRAFT_450142 [Hypoxylon rubiginosum]